MSNNLQHSEYQELLGAYALDAVDETERVEIEAHLAECPRCRAEVDAHREVAAALGNSVEELPVGLWDRIADNLDQRGQDVPPMPALSSQPPASDSGGQIVDLDQARAKRSDTKTRGGAVGWVSAAVAVAAVVIIGLLSVNLVQSNRTVHQLSLQTGSNGISTNGSQVVDLKTSQGTLMASFLVGSNGKGSLVTSKMPPLPSSETYQLWAIINGQPISMGLLGNKPNQATFTAGSSVKPTELAITVEPASGTAAPTQDLAASGRILPA